MTTDELERVMNFIVERQAETADRLAEMSARQVEHDERIARFERSYTAIATLLQRHDTQLEALTTALNSLTAIVERYITARGNNGSSGGA